MSELRTQIAEAVARLVVGRNNWIDGRAKYPESSGSWEEAAGNWDNMAADAVMVLLEQQPTMWICLRDEEFSCNGYAAGAIVNRESHEGCGEFWLVKRNPSPILDGKKQGKPDG